MPVYEPATSPEATAEATPKAAGLTIDWASPTRSDSTVVRGDVVTFSGNLSNDVGPIAGATVYVLQWDTVTQVEIWRGTTDSAGNYAFDYTFPTAVTYIDYTAKFDGDATHDAASAVVKPVLESRVPNLTITMPASAVVGTKVNWSGFLTDPKVTTYGISGKSIYLQESTDRVTFTDVAGPITTLADGSYIGSYVLPSVPGTYYYRSRFPGGSHEASVSSVIKVEVKTELTAWDRFMNWWNSLSPVQKGLVVLGIAGGAAGTYCLAKKGKGG